MPAHGTNSHVNLNRIMHYLEALDRRFAVRAPSPARLEVSLNLGPRDTRVCAQVIADNLPRPVVGLGRDAPHALAALLDAIDSEPKR